MSEKSNFMRPELFSRKLPFEMTTSRFGARVPEGWASTPEYLGPERREGERRNDDDRRTFSRLGDGRIPRRSGRGRRFDEQRGMQYAGLIDRD